jgi:hypothetical protein
MNNDDLGFLHQVLDLEVISLGDSQWHRIRDFRRDGPTDCPDAGNSNDGTRQHIRENGTAAHYSHEFFPCPNVFERCRCHDIVSDVAVFPRNASSYAAPFVSRRVRPTFI